MVCFWQGRKIEARRGLSAGAFTIDFIYCNTMHIDKVKNRSTKWQLTASWGRARVDQGRTRATCCAAAAMASSGLDGGARMEEERASRSNLINSRTTAVKHQPPQTETLTSPADRRACLGESHPNLRLTSMVLSQFALRTRESTPNYLG